MNKQKAKEILDQLNELFPNPVCFLNHKNNFELIVAVTLSAQTTDERVNSVTPKLFSKYPNPYSLASANYDDLLKIISSLGLAKTKAKNLIALGKELVEKYEGEVPSDKKNLVTLPGVGVKTANVVQAVGFKIPAIAVDTHVYRVSYRLGFRKENETLLETEKKLEKYLPKARWIDAHHQFILFGRNFCKAIKPKCDECILKKYCILRKKDYKND